jgi:hypothetical protein
MRYSAMRRAIRDFEGPDGFAAVIKVSDGYPTRLDPFDLNDSIRLNQPYYRNRFRNSAESPWKPSRSPLRIDSRIRFRAASC